MERPNMSYVADVAREECVPARRVDGFEHDLRAGPQLVIGRFEEAHQVIRIQMLHHLRSEQTSERSVRLGEEIAQSIAGHGVEPAFAADGRHLVVEIDSSGGNTLL